MEESEVNYIVGNFKGMTWDELDDALASAGADDLKNLIHMLKVRLANFSLFVSNLLFNLNMLIKVHCLLLFT